MIGALVAALLGAGAAARPLDGTDSGGLALPGAAVEAEPAQRNGVSLEEAIRIATEQHPGRVVRAVTIEEGGNRIHEIRILLPADEGGRIVTVRIEAGGGR